MQGWRAFYKRNTLEPFYLGWLGNVQRFITRAKPLHDPLNPLFCDVFAAVVVSARSLLLWSIKSHDVDLSVFCLLLYLWFKPRSHWKILSEQLSEKDCTISEEHTGKRCFSLDHRTTNRQGNLWSLYQNGILTWRRSHPSIRLNVH